MAKEIKLQVKNIYKAKEEKNLAEAFQNKVAQLICKKADSTEERYNIKN